MPMAWEYLHNNTKQIVSIVFPKACSDLARKMLTEKKVYLDSFLNYYLESQLKIFEPNVLFLLKMSSIETTFVYLVLQKQLY